MEPIVLSRIREPSIRGCVVARIVDHDALLVTGITALVGFPNTAFIISALNVAAFAVAALCCAGSYGRDLLPPAGLLSLVPYVVGKLGLYGAFPVAETSVAVDQTRSWLA